MNVVPLHRGQPERARVLPHNLDAEASVLGGILLRNEVLRELDALETDHFYDLRHRVVWEAVRNLAARGTPIDMTTLPEEIRRAGKLDAIGGEGFLGEMTLRVPTADNVVHYAKIVREKHVAREIALKAHALYERALKDGDGYEPDELLAEARTEFAAVERAFRADNDEVPFITVGQALENLDALARSAIYETPFRTLNQATGFGGLLGGQIYYLTAGTGIGKTTWVGAVAQHYASTGGDVLVATWEMMAGYFVARIAAGPLGVHSNAIIRAEVSARDVLDTVDPKIKFLERPSLEVLKRGARKMARRSGRPPLIVIDYIQLLAEQVAATMARPDPRQATSIASGVLRDIASELGSAVLVVSSTSRAANKRLSGGDVRKVHPAELVDVSKESGSIEFDGAAVIVLSLSEDFDGQEQIATMTIAKNRFGEKCHVDMRFVGRSGTWRDVGRVEHTPKVKPGAAEATEEEREDVIRRAVVKDLQRKPAANKTALVNRLKGYRKEVVRLTWDELVAEGVIAKVGTGFTLTERGRGEFQTQLPEGSS